MVTEGLKSLIAGAYEKFNSPFAGTFIGVWIIKNWELVTFYFLGNYPVHMKISYISANYISIEQNLIHPLAYTFLALIIYAPISVVVFIFWEYMQSIKTSFKYWVTKTSTVPREQWNGLLENYRGMEQTQYEASQEYEKTINSLRNTISELKAENLANTETNSDTEQEADFEPGPAHEFEPEPEFNGSGNHVDSEHVSQTGKNNENEEFNARDYILSLVDVIDERAKLMQTGDNYSLTTILGEHYDNIPRTERKNVEGEFYTIVKDLYFTGIMFYTDKGGVHLYKKK